MPDRPPELPCWVCGKPKGQPPDRCPGHYSFPGEEPMPAPARPLPPVDVLERAPAAEVKRLAAEVMGWSIDHATLDTVRSALIDVVRRRHRLAEDERRALEEAAADAARRTPEALHAAVTAAVLAHGPLDCDDHDDAMVADAVVRELYRRDMPTDLVLVPAGDLDRASLDSSRAAEVPSGSPELADFHQAIVDALSPLDPDFDWHDRATLVLDALWDAGVTALLVGDHAPAGQLVAYWLLDPHSARDVTARALQTGPDGQDWLDALRLHEEAVDALSDQGIALLVAACDAVEPLSPGAVMIAAERARQIEVEGWTADHDDAHAEGDLYEAAAAYLLGLGEPEGMPPPDPWPWGAEWYKPGDPVRTLVKAGALIAAELDRLRRATAMLASTCPACHANLTPHDGGEPGRHDSGCPHARP